MENIINTLQSADRWGFPWTRVSAVPMKGSVKYNVKIEPIPHREDVYRIYLSLIDGKTAVFHARIDEQRNDAEILTSMIFPENFKISDIKEIMGW